MIKRIFLISLFFGFYANAQVVTDWQKYADTLSVTINQYGDEEVAYELEELFINFSKEEIERIKTMNILKRRILRVYPYVVATADNLTILNDNLAKMDTKRRRKNYIKRSEGYLNDQFEERLKKLSRKDGQILVKLINRQTGQTTFDLVKEFKSGWSAFWSNQTARLFDIDLKAKYNPAQTLEDFYIEEIIQELHQKNKIDYRAPALYSDLEKLQNEWREKLGDSGYYPE